MTEYFLGFLAVAACVGITMLLVALFLDIFTNYFKD